MCGLYIVMLQNQGLGFVWFVHCHVTESRARVCVVCTLICYIIKGEGMFRLYIAVLHNSGPG